MISLFGMSLEAAQDPCMLDVNGSGYLILVSWKIWVFERFGTLRRMVDSDFEMVLLLLKYSLSQWRIGTMKDRTGIHPNFHLHVLMLYLAILYGF